MMSEDILISALKRYFGYTTFRPFQREIIQEIMAGRDAFVLMPTGGGKSVCYQLPAMLIPGLAIVVSPLISLMKDQVDALCAAGMPAAALNSTLTEKEQMQLEADCLAGRVKLLYVSPEMALAKMHSLLSHIQINLFAIDEAHCISQWGADFRPEYARLSVLRDAFPRVPFLALTATADKVTRKDILRQLNLHHPQVFISSFDRPNLSLSVVKEMKKRDKDRAIRSFIDAHHHQSGIIYCLSRQTTEKVCEMLRAHGIMAKPYHAGMTTEERTEVQNQFVRDVVQVICATVAFGMGIDKSNIRWIIHYNLPSSLEAFYQEIGRAGRDGAPAQTMLFYSYADVIQQGKFADESGQREMNRERLRRMQQYAEASICRRRILLNYFGEEMATGCQNCDVCKCPPRHFDGTILAQKLMSAAKRTDEHYDIKVLTDILTGSFSAPVRDNHLEMLKTFGVGRDVSRTDWQDYALQLLHMGYIEIVYDERNRVVVTPLGEKVLFEGAKVQMVEQDKKVLPTSSRKKHAPSPAFPGLYMPMEEDPDLYEALRQLRLRLAEDQRMPPYIIFSDKVLHELARIKPLSIEAFGDISGVGEYKQNRYGSVFVDEIRKYVK